MNFISVVLVCLFLATSLLLTWQGISIKNNLKKELDSFQKMIDNRITKCEESNHNNKEYPESLERIIKEIETKFKEAIKVKQQQVNTLSIIERVWKKYQPESFTKDKNSYKILPNFLLAIGLFGTFLGISANLFLLAGNIDNPDTLDKSISDIIGSMAIAFLSSLFGLGCSSYINKWHNPYILDKKEERLIASYEYYLDEVYGFYLFKEISFVNKLDNIVTKFEESTNKASETLTDSANNFAKTMKSAANKISKSSGVFQTNMDASAEKIEEVTDSFNLVITNLGEATQDFTNVSSELKTSALSIQNALQEMNNYIENLQDLSRALDNNSLELKNLVEINKNNFDIRATEFESMTESWEDTINQLQQQISSQNDNLQSLTRQIQEINNSFSNNLPTIISTLNKQVKQTDNQNTNLKSVTKEIKAINHNFNENLPPIIKGLNEQIQQMGNQNANLRDISQQIQGYFQELYIVTQNIDILINELSKLQDGRSGLF